MEPMQSKIIPILAAILTFNTGPVTSDVSLVYGPPPPATLETRPATPRPQYVYAYDVRDPQSGVYTSKQESRDGDVVYGSYAVNDADGSRRVVHYTADPVRGFNAQVRRQGVAPLYSQVQLDRVKPIAVPFPFPIALPVVQTYVAPPPSPPPPLQLGAPLALSLAPAILTRSSPAPAPLEFEPPRFHTSLRTPTHSYSY